jgi:hypothetical protein
MTWHLCSWQFSLFSQNVDQWSLQRGGHFIVPNYRFHLLDALNGTDFSRRAQRLAESKA